MKSMKKKTAKKTVKKKAAKATKRPAKAKAKAKAKPKMKAKTKAPAKRKTASSDHGLTVIDLFKMKRQREQQAAQDAEGWKHKKDLPQQDMHQPEDAKGAGMKKSGFGGARHH